MSKKKFIIDTDPGVDDSAALSLSLYDEVMEIVLVTTVSGNLDVDSVTHNALHLLEKFCRTDIPLAKGATKPLVRDAKDAKFIHQNYGMGNYIPPKEIANKPIKLGAVEAMYRTIKQYEKDINIILLGPHTNLANLIKAHPDVVHMINHVYCEGCSAYDNKIEGSWKHYISFNASSDPEAMQIVFNSGIPVTIVPSRMGRELANFNEKEVLSIRDINDTGRWIFEMYSGYWEPTYKDRRIATNDTCAVLAARYPKLFKTKRAYVDVNTTDMPGKTTFNFNKRGNVEYVYKVNRKKMHKFYFDAVAKLNRFKFYDANATAPLNLKKVNNVKAKKAIKKVAAQSNYATKKESKPANKIKVNNKSENKKSTQKPAKTKNAKILKRK